MRGKEFKIESRNNYSVKLGTVNNKNPKCIYFEIKGWGQPTVKDEIDYNKIINGITKKIKTLLHNTINYDDFEKTYLLDFDLRSSGIKYGKKSYFNCEVTLYQKNVVKDLFDLKESIKYLSDDIINNVLEKTEYFNFKKNK